MSGGKGGDDTDGSPGGAGGTGYQGGAEGRGQNGGRNSAIYAGGGGGGGAGGGAGGNGGDGAAGGAGGVNPGAAGGNGSSATFAAGGGGGGGQHGVVAAALTNNGVNFLGGNGGNGASSFAGGGGGAGGYGAVVTGNGSSNTISTIAGGNGGLGGNNRGVGGDGGIGVFFTPAASGASLITANQITGGNGGLGSGGQGLGGAGVVGQNLTITNTGSITGGMGRGGQADAITFTSGTNVLNVGGTITGNLAILADTLQINAVTGGSTVANVITGAGGLIQNTANKLTLTGGNTYTGATTIAGGTLALSDAGSIASSSGVLNSSVFDISGLTGTSTTLKAYSGAGSTNLGAKNLTIQNGGTVDGVISGSGGSLTLTGGNLTLTGINTYTGGTTISGGTLRLDQATANGTTINGAGTGLIKVNSGTLELADSGPLANGVEAAAGATIAATTGTTATLAGSLLFGGSGSSSVRFGSTVDAGTIVLAATAPPGIQGGTTLEIAGGTLRDSGGAFSTLGFYTRTADTTQVNAGATLDFNGQSGTEASIRNLQGEGGTAGGTVTNTVASTTTIRSGSFAGVLAGQGSYAFATGTTTLTGINTYTGGTTISSNGVLAASSSSALGDGSASNTLIFNGGTLRAIGTITSPALRDVSLTGNGTIDTNGNTASIGGVVSGAGALSKVGGGTLTLSGSNSYAGATTISAGILNIQSNAALGSVAGNTTVSSGATLQLQNGITTSEALTLSGNGSTGANGALQNVVGNNTVNGAITLAASARINSDVDTLTLAGGISGNAAGRTLTLGGAGNGVVSGAINAVTGGLVKDGAGTWTLSANNSYASGTTVAAGTLLVTGSIGSLGTTTVNNGANLGGTGTIVGAVNVAGQISAGLTALSGIGTLNTGALTLTDANAVLRQDVTNFTTADKIAVTGAVTLAGTLDLHFANTFASRTGENFVFIDNDGTADLITTRFSNIALNGAPAVAIAANDTFTFDNHTYRIDYRGGDGNDVAIRDVTFVPGPTQPTNPTTPTTPTQPTGPTAEALMKFGMIVTDPASQAGQVYGLYEALLNRAPDPLGLENFTTALQNGASLVDVANALLASGERGGGVTDPTAFVQSLYQNLLNRPADASGLATFTNELANGVSPATVAVQLATSAEAQALLAPTFANGVFVPDASESSVARLYYGLLDRAPDQGGLQALSAFIENGGGGPAGEAARLFQVVSSILTSPEYVRQHAGQSDAAFVTELYQDALGRAPDAGGQAAALSALTNGASRAQIAFDITQSPEAQVHLVGQIQEGALLVA